MPDLTQETEVNMARAIESLKSLGFADTTDSVPCVLPTPNIRKDSLSGKPLLVD